MADSLRTLQTHRAVPILLVIVSLIAACAGPTPTPGPATPAPASPAPSALPSATPGVTPLPTTATAAWSAVDLPPLVPVAILEATRAVAAGALPDTAFRLASLDGSDPAALAARLTVEPDLDLRVTRTDGAVATLTPAAPLRLGGSWRVSLRSPAGLVRAAWAIQAVQPLHVVTTTPGDESTGVPRDTGIEVTFDQDGIDLAEATPFLALSPSVPGSFVQSGRTIAFAPTNPLAAGTLYRLTVRHGLPLHGTTMTLEQDVVVAFETDGGAVSRTRVTFGSPLVETRPTAPAVMGVRVDSEVEDVDPPAIRAGIVVHRLPGMDAAIRAWRTIQAAPDWAMFSGTAPVDTSSLPKVLAGTVDLRLFRAGAGWERWFQLPRALPAGWYIVTMTYDRVPREAILQVTDVAAYTLVTETRTIAWVNDLATKRPLAGARVGMLGSSLGRTATNGILVARTPAALRDPTDDAGPAVIRVTSGDRGVFVPVGVEACGKCDGSGRITSPWVLFQPDRYRYRTTDTLNAWGVVRDRSTLAVPASVTVRLVPLDDSGAGRQVIDSRSATPDASGSFLVQLAFADVPNGEYNLQLVVAGTVISERGLTVGPIVKPAWTLDLSTTKHAVISGTPVRVQATAAFFDGTPVAGADITLSSNDTTAALTTGELGTGSASVSVLQTDDTSQWEVIGIDGRPARPEEGSITGGAMVAAFRASVIVRLASTVDGTVLRLSGSVHDVAFGRFEQPGVADLGAVNPFGAVVAGTRVRLRIVEHIPVRIRDGTRYDFITKRVVPAYRYDDKIQNLGTRTVTTDAKGRFRLSLTVAGGDHSYEVSGSATDASGRRTTEQAWSNQAESNVGRTLASLAPVDGSPDAYGVGDRVDVAYTGGSGRSATSRYLWTTSQGGLRTWSLTTRPRLTTTFGASSVPGVTINAVRFTGTGYEVPAGSFTALFRQSDRRLNVTVTADKSRYVPGGRATVTVRTTTPSGNPVAATVFVRVVDEKLYAIGAAVDENPLDPLYALPGSGILGTGWTHADPSPSDEGGGDTTGGGGSDRGDFRDWLVAKLVRTGADGRATLSFDLSDDLTSWRVTGSAVTRTLRAGLGHTTLPVGLPFFAEATIAPEYLVTDRPIITLRGFGSGLGAASQVTFTVTSDTLPMAATTVSAAAFHGADVALPPLSLGTHRVRIEAVTGSGPAAQRDTLIRTFTVTTSRTVQARTTSVLLNAPTAVTGGTGLTTLVLGDAGRGRVVPILESLRTIDPIRGDSAVAAALAARVLRDDLGLPVADIEAAQGDVSRFQVDSGISVVPYGAPEPELTALATMAGDPRLDRAQLIGWLGSQETTTREGGLWLLVGRAAAGEPVLSLVQSAATQPDLTVREQVVLSLAALAAGDETLAGRLERAVLASSGERQGSWVRVASGTPDEQAVLTARLAIVAASLGDTVAGDMDAFVAANAPTSTLVVLERALAARGWVRRIAPADASAVLTVDGSPTTIAIHASQPVQVVLTPAQVATARLEPGSGSVLVTTTTEQPLDPATLKAPAGASLTRTIRPGTSVAATDLVIVELVVEVPATPVDMCWLVTDTAPSGLVPIDRPEEATGETTGETTTLPPMRITGQQVQFCVTWDGFQPKQTLRYAARVVTAGSYRWEASVLQSPLFPELGLVVAPEPFEIRPAGR